MAREAGVCNQCYRNCLLLHGGKHDEPLKVPTFFKVLFGKKFSELLFVPPKHSRMLSSMVGKKSYLEDSTGQEWEVILSDVEGCLAFKKGWNKFCIDHDIELGDFLVFHFIRESHFMVTVYGRSGWEKDFPGEWSYQNKRPKTTRKRTTKNFPSDSFFEEREPRQDYGCFEAFAVPQSDTDSIPSQDIVDNLDKSFVVARNVSEAELIGEPSFMTDKKTIGEPSFMTDKKTTFAREDDREHLLDLSAFELPDMKSCKAMKGDNVHLFDLPTYMMNNEKINASDYHTKQQLKLDCFDLPDMRSSVGRKVGEGYLSHPSTCKKTVKKVDANHICKLQGSDYSQVSGTLHEVQAGDASINTNKSQLGQGHAIAPAKETEAILRRSKCGAVLSASAGLYTRLNAFMPHETIKKLDPSEPSALSGTTMRVVKQEPREFRQDLYRNSELSSNKETKSNHGDLNVNLGPVEDDQDIQIVKSEPVDFCDPASALVSKITCSIPPENESFLELPEPLPMKQRQRMRLNMKLIFLRNPAGKVWPVIYHNKNGVKVLASGWNAFEKANNIRPGDECVFVVDDLDKEIFSVHILNTVV